MLINGYKLIPIVFLKAGTCATLIGTLSKPSFDDYILFQSIVVLSLFNQSSIDIYLTF
jgi:hypothetical protein